MLFLTRCKSYYASIFATMSWRTSLARGCPGAWAIISGQYPLPDSPADRHVILLIFSFASKEESEGSEEDYSEESSEEEEEMEKDQKTGNKFSLLQVED